MEIDSQKIASCPICTGQSVYYNKKSGYTYFKCSSCGLIYLDPLPTATEEIYSDQYFQGADLGYGYVDYDLDKKSMDQAFKLYISKIKSYTEGRNLLDVGAATGYFINIAKEYGFITQGIEISAFAAHKAKEKGLDVFNGTLKDFVSHTKFEVVTMLDVIEHVLNPTEEIKAVSTLQPNGGIVIINTPDAGSVFAKVLGAHWHLLIPPEHVHCFTKKSMSVLLNKAGYEILEYTKIGKSFSVEYVIHTLNRWTKISFFSTILQWLKKYPKVATLSLPINLRDNMFVIARKHESK